MRHSWVISYEKIDGERDLCKSVLLRNYPIYPYNVFNMLANYYLIRYAIFSLLIYKKKLPLGIYILGKDWDAVWVIMHGKNQIDITNILWEPIVRMIS